MPKFVWDEPAEWVEMEGNPTPPNVDIGILRARDGRLLRCGIFHPDGDARASIVLMTGYSEFIEKYFETIIDLQNAGYCVVLPEWRGHGLSQGNSKVSTRLHLTDFDQNITDLEDRLEKLLADCPRPHFGLAHSMGGQISLRMAHKHPDQFTALAQSAPMHGLIIPTMAQRMIRWIASAYVLAGRSDRWIPMTPPASRPGNPATNHVTTDWARYQRNEHYYVTEPRLQVNGVSLSWMSAAMAAMKNSIRPAFLRSFTTPLFIGMAEKELLVDNKALLYVQTNVPNGQGKTYKGAMHEILMEKDAIRQAFIADVLGFYQSVKTH